MRRPSPSPSRDKRGRRKQAAHRDCVRIHYGYDGTVSPPASRDSRSAPVRWNGPPRAGSCSRGCSSRATRRGRRWPTTASRRTGSSPFSRARCACPPPPARLCAFCRASYLLLFFLLLLVLVVAVVMVMVVVCIYLAVSIVAFSCKAWGVLCWHPAQHGISVLTGGQDRDLSALPPRPGYQHSTPDLLLPRPAPPSCSPAVRPAPPHMATHRHSAGLRHVRRHVPRIPPWACRRAALWRARRRCWRGGGRARAAGGHDGAEPAARPGPAARSGDPAERVIIVKIPM